MTNSEDFEISKKDFIKDFRETKTYDELMEAYLICSEEYQIDLNEYLNEIEKDDEKEEKMICSVCNEECKLSDESTE